MPTSLSNLKSKVDKLDVAKLESFPVGLRKLSAVVKNDAVKKDVYNAKIKNIEAKTLDITNLATHTIRNAEINDLKDKISSITNLATTATVIDLFIKADHIIYIIILFIIIIIIIIIIYIYIYIYIYMIMFIIRSRVMHLMQR